MPAIADPVQGVREQVGLWRDDPALFAHRFLRVERLIGKSVEILEALRDHKRVAVAACHASSKTFTASIAAWWWALACQPSKVITTAPTDRQVRALLWAEIRQRHQAAQMEQYGLGGIRLTHWQMPEHPDWYMTGFATSGDKAEEGATKFQGFHSPNLLVIFDEAAGIPKAIYDAAEGLMTGQNSRWLLIGNPTDSTGEFAKAYRDKAWHSIRIDALELVEDEEPLDGLVTADWCAHMRQKYGEGSSVYQAKVRGLFPQSADDTLISLAEVQLALARPVIAEEPGTRSMGVDVARFGSDFTVLYVVEGGRILHAEARNGQDTMWTAGRVISLANEQGIDKTRAHLIAVDDTGLGGGVTDRLREQGWNVNAENFGSRAQDSATFADRRTELWWNLREWVRDDAALADAPSEVHAELPGDLSTPKYEQQSNGKIKLEAKKALKRRLGRSPDHGDALALALAWRTRGPAIMTSADDEDEPVEVGRRGSWRSR